MGERTRWQIIVILILGGLSFALLFNGASFSTPFLRAWQAVLPVLGGFGLAFLLGIPMSALEHLWIRLFGEGKPSLRRGVCLALTLSLTCGLLILLGSVLLPALMKSLSRLIARLPEYAQILESLWSAISERLASYSIVLPPLSPEGQVWGERLAQYMQENGEWLWRFSFEFVRSSVSFLWDGAISLVLSIYILAKKERHAAALRRFLDAVCSCKTVGRLARFWQIVRECFTRFIVGQSCEALILGVLCFVGMLVFDFPYALLISVVIGVSALIPIFGALIGTAVGALLIFLESPSDALWFVLFVLVLQQLEGNLIYPRVVGRSVGLPSLWVLVAVTVGGSFGVLGMLCAVPLASIVYTLLGEWVHTREKRAKKEL